MVLDRVEAGDAGDVTAAWVEPELPADTGEPQPAAYAVRLTITWLAATVTLQLDTVLDDLDAANREAIDPCQGLSAEAAASIDGIREVIESKPVDGPSQRRDDVGKVSAMLGEDKAGIALPNYPCQCGIEEWRVLVSVNNLDIPGVQFVSQPPNQSPIAPRTSAKRHDSNTLPLQPFPEGPHAVETKYGGLNP